MLDMAGFGERMRQALAARGVSQSELARRLGVKPQAVQYLCSPQAQRSRYTQEIAAALDVNATWLATGKGSMEEEAPRFSLRRDEGATYGVTPRRIPVISHVQAGDPRPVMDEYMAGDGFRTISLEGEIAEQVGPYTFALQISGDSMADEFQDGDTVVVDPDAPVRPGDIVVAKLEHEQAATIKKYRERGYDENSKPIIELKPLNEDYAPVTMDARNPGTVIGPVVEHRRRLRR